jgi:hypothetical protein
MTTHAETQSTSSTKNGLRRWPLTCASAAIGITALALFGTTSACSVAEAPEEAVAAQVIGVENIATPDAEAKADAFVPPPAGADADVVDEAFPAAPAEPSDITLEELPAAAPMPAKTASATVGRGAPAKKSKAKPRRRIAKGGEGMTLGGMGDGEAAEKRKFEAEESIARDERFGYDKEITARRLTAGTHDDNRDHAGWHDFLNQMSWRMQKLGLTPEQMHPQDPGPRHADDPHGLDIVLVMDTTGSMGDELEYLKVELQAIAAEVNHEFPQVDQRWGMVAYKDVGDEYVTRVADFADIGSFSRSLGIEHASGGGDMPEAMDLALHASSGLSWRRGDDTARLVFLVGDAPPHAGNGTTNYMKAVENMRAEKTTLYPVAGSGVDDDAEVLMRVGAKMTGGQYIFLTDHSGIGGHHAAPHVKDYQVETLHDAMRRMIRLELGDQPAQAVAVHNPPQVAVDPHPLVDYPPCVTEDEPSMWDKVKSRLEAHFTFAAGFFMWLMMAIFIDTRLRRRREHIA